MNMLNRFLSVAVVCPLVTMVGAAPVIEKGVNGVKGAENAGHTDRKVTMQTSPGALEWLWKGYPLK